MIDKWKVKVGNTTHEFANEQAADNFASQNNSIAEPVVPEYAQVEVKEVPQIVSPRQIRQALVLSGFSISAIEITLSSIEDEQQKALALIAWEYATECYRYDDLVKNLAPLLSLTEDDLDDLWIFAATM